VQITTPWSVPDWDEWISQHPRAGFFYTVAWARTLVETYGYRPVYLVKENSGQRRAVLPLMEVDSWLTGRRGIALPFTDECPPLAEDDSTGTELFQQAVEYGKERNWKYLECRGGRPAFKHATASLSFYGHELDLTQGEAKIFGSLDGSIRQGVRKAEKEAVTVEISQTGEAMQSFYELQLKTRRRHGLPPQPWEFFLNIHRNIVSQKGGMVSVARHQGQPVAAAVYFYLGGRAVYKYGASDFDCQHLRPNHLVMWSAIKWLIQKGATSLHFGRTSLAHDGLRRFKLAWGTKEEAIEYVKYDLKKNVFTTSEDEVSGWHNRVFRTMPASWSRLAGRILYKHCA
jgi:lipid II:glycine glycyltransferase (peptidoglycan interpeptide bridge formation enzyme)